MKAVAAVHTHACFGYHIWSAGLQTGLDELARCARDGNGGFACFANAHMVGEAAHNGDLHAAMLAANWVFPDGKPVAAMLRLRGAGRAQQMPGPEVTEHVLTRAAAEGLPVYLYGDTPDLLARLKTTLLARYPTLRLAGTGSPPFGARTVSEETADAAAIRASGAAFCLVALGCPRQETWMHRNARGTGAVCLGVGAAFQMLTGDMPRAPAWVRRFGLEWAYRWMQEPRRLTQRYTVGNLRFARQIVRELSDMRRG